MRDHRLVRAAQDRRERRADTARRRTRRRLPDPARGIVSASPHELLAAIRALDPDLAWEDLADQLLPVLRRRRPWPPEAGAPSVVSMPPGIEVGFGIDIGPGFAHVGPSLLEKWGVTLDTVRERAIGNLRRHATREELIPSIRELVGNVPVHWYESGEGWGSALVLLPNELERRVPAGPHLIVAPMRDLVLSVPDGTDAGFVMDLRDEFALRDPNGLDLPVFRLSDCVLTVVPDTMRAGGGRIH